MVHVVACKVLGWFPESSSPWNDLRLPVPISRVPGWMVSFYRTPKRMVIPGPASVRPLDPPLPFPIWRQLRNTLVREECSTLLRFSCLACLEFEPWAVWVSHVSCKSSTDTTAVRQKGTGWGVRGKGIGGALLEQSLTGAKGAGIREPGGQRQAPSRCLSDTVASVPVSNGQDLPCLGCQACILHLPPKGRGGGQPGCQDLATLRRDEQLVLELGGAQAVLRGSGPGEAGGGMCVFGWGGGEAETRAAPSQT